MQGSGSFGVESVLTSAVKDTDKLLVLSNGEYGKRIIKMCDYIGINHVDMEFNYEETIDVEKVKIKLEEDNEITHVIMVHCETTTGLLNPLEEVVRVVKDNNKTFIVDAMSSFGGIVIKVDELKIDFLISGANKCIQGVPGFSFIIAKRDALEGCNGYQDLYV